MIYLPEDKWSSRYSSEFYTVRLNAWHYVRSKNDLLLLQNPSASIAATATGTPAALFLTTSTVCDGANSQHDIERSSYHFDYETTTSSSIDNNKVSDDNQVTSAHQRETPTTTGSFRGASMTLPSSMSSTKPFRSYFCCLPENTNTAIEEEPRLKSSESFPAVYYEIQVLTGRGVDHVVALDGSSRMNSMIVFRRFSHFRALCEDMDDARRRRRRRSAGLDSVHTNARVKKKNSRCTSDLMTQTLHPNHSLAIEWFLSNLHLCRLIWFASFSSSSSVSSITEIENNDGFFEQRMIGLRSFLHTLLCQQESANNLLIEKFLAL